MKHLSEIESDTTDPRGLPIRITFVDKDYSRYALFPILFKFSKVFLDLENKFHCFLKIKSKTDGYPVPKIANSIVNLICCGVDRFVRLDDEFSCELGLAKYLGFRKGFPTSDTIYRFFRKFDGYNLRQLQKINLQILNENKKWWLFKDRTLFVDIDMNIKSVEGKKIEEARVGYNHRRPGRKSLKWTIIHVAKVALYSDLHSGTTSEQKLLKRQLLKIEKLLSKLGIEFKGKGGSENDKGENKVVLRVDGGYVTYDNLITLNDYRFISRLRVDLTVVEPMFSKIDSAEGIGWKTYSKQSSYYDFGQTTFSKSDNLKFRVIIVRVIRKRKILYYPLCTNLFDWDAKSIVKAYRGRQIIENMFRDTNQAFYSDKLPSMKYYANKAFLWFVVLAYNQFFFFRKYICQRNIKGIRLKNFHRNSSKNQVR